MLKYYALDSASIRLPSPDRTSLSLVCTAKCTAPGGICSVRALLFPATSGTLSWL